MDAEGLLRKDNRIYVPNTNDLRLRALRYKHDHILAGHFGQNKTLELVRRKYVWPHLQMLVQDFCKSCSTCAWSKAPQHRPYGFLKQLPIPEKPWNSISIDFIEKLPVSSGFTSILVIVDHLYKQGIFIPTFDTITSVQLAQLFILHVFSQHGVPSHVTSDCGSEFVSHFFHSVTITSPRSFISFIFLYSRSARTYPTLRMTPVIMELWSVVVAERLLALIHATLPTVPHPTSLRVTIGPTLRTSDLLRTRAYY
jgi:hypothetical protein